MLSGLLVSKDLAFNKTMYYCYFGDESRNHLMFDMFAKLENV